MSNTFGYKQARDSLQDGIHQEQGKRTLAPLDFFDVINDSQASYLDITKTGNIVEIDTGLKRPLREIEIAFEPIQDLHGYDYPYPPGGGKNKISVSSISLGGSEPRTKRLQIDPIPAGTYKLSFVKGGTSTGSYGIQFFSEVTGGSLVGNVGSNPATLTLTDTALSVYVYFSQTEYDNNKTLNLTQLQVEEGSTATPFSPYSNICPISGWTQAEIYEAPAYDPDATPAQSIEFPTPPGTVYGGKLTVYEDGSGELSVNHAFIELNHTSWSDPGASENIVTTGSVLTGRYKSADSGTEARIIYGLANCFETLSNGALNNNQVRTNGAATDKLQIVDYKTLFNVISYAEFLVKAEETPIQVVYRIAVPLTYPLTTAETGGIIEALEGNHVIWSNSRPIKVTYLGFNPLFTGDPLSVGITTLN